ncbi:hypothetical protein MRX96_040696 [Rhipicephalus microplus]
MHQITILRKGRDYRGTVCIEGDPRKLIAVWHNEFWHPGTQHVNPLIVRRLHTTEKSIEKGTLRHFGWLVRPDDYKYRHAPRLPRQRWRRETGLWDRSIGPGED